MTVNFPEFRNVDFTIIAHSMCCGHPVVTCTYKRRRRVCEVTFYVEDINVSDSERARIIALCKAN